MAESDTQHLQQDDGIWTVERTEAEEKIIDPTGQTRYHGRHSMTAAHFASALRREEQYRKACVDALQVLNKPTADGAPGPSALIDLRERLRAVLKAGPEFWQKLEIKPKDEK